MPGGGGGILAAVGANVPPPGSPGRGTGSQTPFEPDQAEPSHPHFAVEGGWAVLDMLSTALQKATINFLTC